MPAYSARGAAGHAVRGSVTPPGTAGHGTVVTGPNAP